MVDILYLGELLIKIHCIHLPSPTTGYLGDHPGKGLDLVEANYPCTRWVSRSCAVTYINTRGKGGGLIIGLCPACSGEGSGLEGEGGKVKEELHDNNAAESEDNGLPDHGCQVAIAKFLDCTCLALCASGLWLCYATLQNLIPSFPWIAPGWRVWGRNPRKRRD